MTKNTLKRTVKDTRLANAHKLPCKKRVTGRQQDVAVVVATSAVRCCRPKSDRRDRRMHIYVNDRANKIVRSECKKNGVTIADYIVSAALSFHASDVPQKLDTTLKKLKRYMKRRGIAYKQRGANNGK